MLTIADIVDAVAFPFTVWRTLRGVEPEMQDGRPRYVVGNAAVSFPVRYQGERYMLKCYTRSSDHLAAIYGEAFLARELCVVDCASRYHWVDCLLTEYVDGVTLDEVLCSASTSEEYAALAQGFDALARYIMRSERAHGDLKPENIIVGEDGCMRAVDWDAAFVPRLAGRRAVEIGTAAYQHPLRDSSLYDKHIDDYSIAFISTLLHLSVENPAVMADYKLYREPPFRPHDLVARSGWAVTPVLHDILNLFAQKGLAREYQVATMLRSPYPRLGDLLHVMSVGADAAAADSAAATVEVDSAGRWGCVSGDGWILPPLYTSAVGVAEGVALMELGRYRHFVRLEDGQLLRSFTTESNVGPLRDGCTTAREEDGEERIIRVVVE